MKATIKQIAAQIRANCKALDNRSISFVEFSERQRAAWDAVTRGELCIIGSAAAKRSAKVHKLLREAA